MNKLIKKLLGKLNIVDVLVPTVFILVLVVVFMRGGLGDATDVLAGNTANQVASTSYATTIDVVGKVADTAITTITFPEGAPSATISNPYNDVDTVSDPQVLHATTSDPVVRLKNGSAGTLYVTLQIATWSNSVAASEDYELVVTTDTTIAVVDNVLSTDGSAASVATGISIDAATYKALYLELVLSSLAGKAGTSTLSVLGET